ncbi:TetR/AcrR family transcriptional regulator [Streptomyces sp. HU2014]|uniref:TetR family transcriptional regulator n=1 Tax=Streptomyces albireticuli TaxID=1940 RepID=A0A1Z2KWG1_9ACTN|nr:MULTISPECIES: TetR/AcrR family transcriptional regulator [Streptomyces]ARZ66356.1 TetR family transcriptional regulator [Streptomyces albireticuli]UQI46581.1 TetR/AcrR family transcriptional regulator [Streptomyces sp. HU2014]
MDSRRPAPTPSSVAPELLTSLPLAGKTAPERADAARNRRRILDAAARIVARHGVQGLTVDLVAGEAGIGVGTLYRRFGDRAGLVFALLDEHERGFQRDFMTGPPPLGPGAEPGARIRAFLHALADRGTAQFELILAAEASAPGARYRSGPYAVHHTHLVTLLTQVTPPGTDVRFLADALLAPVSALLMDHQRQARGTTAQDVKAGLDDLLRWSLG